ncbi:WYL domain-containing protein [Paenibacillus alba]|uniref:WYL domain-containing protein n=2 Tax=Paenibacillus alba TaxID=1197127 RepID=A0ABU6G4M4_9BACL|nr:WYL domain-containing protein [Paenibacillus alba]
MNLFEKIFNYQMIARLEDSGTFMITSQERSWLKTMLNHPTAAHAFTPLTREKLQSVLAADPAFDLTEAFLEKARSREKHIYHPHLRELRRYIASQTAVQLTYRVKDERVFTDELAFPYKLEYSLVKKEWYLLWYHIRNRAMMSSKLDNIESLQALIIAPERIAQIGANIDKLLQKRQIQAKIEVVNTYNRELSRILYAFSCFEKQVNYEEATDTYTIQLTFMNNEAEYVLTKIRFLGLRVRVTEGEHLQKRMAETVKRALARYEEK